MKNLVPHLLLLLSIIAVSAASVMAAIHIRDIESKCEQSIVAAKESKSAAGGAIKKHDTLVKQLNSVLLKLESRISALEPQEPEAETEKLEGKSKEVPKPEK